MGFRLKKCIKNQIELIHPTCEIIDGELVCPIKFTKEELNDKIDYILSKFDGDIENETI